MSIRLPIDHVQPSRFGMVVVMAEGEHAIAGSTRSLARSSARRALESAAPNTTRIECGRTETWLTYLGHCPGVALGEGSAKKE